MLFTGYGSVHMVKNCDLSLEMLLSAVEFSRPWSQFFTMRTSQPANKIYLLLQNDLQIFPQQSLGC